jgi:hypothetical protein
MLGKDRKRTQTKTITATEAKERILLSLAFFTLTGYLKTERENGMIYRGPGFLAVV